MVMAVTRYLLVSLPLDDSASTKWAALQESISKVAFDTPTYRLHIPELRVGTLDTLLALSDDLIKANSMVEGVTHKIRRQIEELDHSSGVESTALTVDGVPVDSYITRFTWDDAKNPTMTPLGEIVELIKDHVAKIEDDLKVRVGEYNNVKSQLSIINRKRAGSLAVRDLSNLVKPDDIVTSEHLTTLLVIVSKYSQKEWLSSYESFADFVVPRSSKKLHEDNEYALYTVILFRKVEDNFKTSARERGFLVREIDVDGGGNLQQEQELEQLTTDLENLRQSLQQWCYASYGEVFSSWVHIAAIRLFTESILRYGLPPAFLAAVLAPSVRNEKKIRNVLDSLTGSRNSSFWKAEDDVGMANLIGGEAESHPYVSITLNLAG